MPLQWVSHTVWLPMAESPREPTWCRGSRSHSSSRPGSPPTHASAEPSSATTTAVSCSSLHLLSFPCTCFRREGCGHFSRCFVSGAFGLLRWCRFWWYLSFESLLDEIRVGGANRIRLNEENLGQTK